MPISKVRKMPVKKIIKRPVTMIGGRSMSIDEPVANLEKINSCKLRCCSDACFGKKMILTLVGVFLAYLIFYFGTLISSNLKEYRHIGIADRSEKVLTISGKGTITADNNIAITTIGFSNTNKDVAQAQIENNKVMDSILSDLKNLNVEDKDLKTNYRIYPEYNYTEEAGRELVGYSVNNTVTIKIRDLSKINKVLGLAGKHGATKIGGLSFTIDDTDSLKDEAREVAFLDVQKKAEELSKSLGVKLGAVVSYNEYDASADPYSQKYFLNSDRALDIGGEVMPETVMSGSKDIEINLNVTFEILQ